MKKRKIRATRNPRSILSAMVKRLGLNGYKKNITLPCSQLELDCCGSFLIEGLDQGILRT